MAPPEYFDYDAVEVDDTVSCIFKMDGRDWSCRNRDLIDARIADAMLGNGGVTIGAFFSEILIPEDVEDFLALVNSDDFPMPVKKVQALMEFLSEKIMNRPTVRPVSSGRGSPNTRAISEEVSSSRVTPRRRSAG